MTSSSAPKSPTSGPVSTTPATREHRAERDGEPGAVDAEGQRAAEVARSEPAGHAGGGAVGEEDAQPDRGLQHRGRDAEPGELRGAEMADHRGVGEQEERLGHERQEGRDGQPHDLAVVAPVRPHA